jgi:hypothetical protein
MTIEIKKEARRGYIALGIYRDGTLLSHEYIYPPGLLEKILHPGITFRKKVERKENHFRKLWEDIDREWSKKEQMARDALGATG